MLSSKLDRLIKSDKNESEKFERLLGEDEKQNFILVNIWAEPKDKTQNQTIITRVSFETKIAYFSLWSHWQDKKFYHKSNAFFVPKENDFYKKLFSRPPSITQDYENDCVAEGISKYQARYISHISECQYPEKPYLWDSKNVFKLLNENPVQIDAANRMVAVKPCEANIRICLYTLRKDSFEHSFKEMISREYFNWLSLGNNIIYPDLKTYPQNLVPAYKSQVEIVAKDLLYAGGMHVNDLFHTNENYSIPETWLIDALVAYKEEKESKRIPNSWKHPLETPLNEIKQKYDIHPILKNNKGVCTII